MTDRSNSFDLIRHFAAFLVLFSHHFALFKLPEPVFLHWETLSFVAAVIFFAISGYFMPSSFIGSGNIGVFLAKRCRRLLPGLIFGFFIIISVIGGIFSPRPVKNLLGLFSVEHFIANLSFFLGRDSLNNSLLTLPVTFLNYIIIGIIFSYMNSWKTVLPLLGGYACLTMGLVYSRSDFLLYAIQLKHLSILGIAFAFGALMAVTQKHWLGNKLTLAVIAVVFLLVLPERPEMPVLGTLSLALLTIIVGVSVKDSLINRKFDISYGVYIYAFPTQQMVIHLITQQFWLSMVISVIFTIFIASFSYRFVEKPFLYDNARKQAATKEMSTAFL